MVTVLPEIVATPVLPLVKTSGWVTPDGPFNLNGGSPKVLDRGPQATPGSVVGMPVMGAKGTPEVGAGAGTVLVGAVVGMPDMGARVTPDVGADVVLVVVVGGVLGMLLIGVRVTASELVGDLSEKASEKPPVAPPDPPPPQAASTRLRSKGKVMRRTLAAVKERLAAPS